MSDRPYKNVPTAELIESAKADLANVLVQLADPNSVHIAMLRGEIAKPSVRQIIHIYGREALLAELEPADA